MAVAAATLLVLLFSLPPTPSRALPTRISSQIPYACDPRNEQISSLPFCNVSLPRKDRVLDLISRLTLQEKVSQLRNGAPALPALGIPAYQWWSEALHGLSDNGPGVRFGDEVPAVTTFPQVILTAASFNSSLWYLIAQAISTEARAMHNVGLSGLTYWAPNINIFRDPRWGRGQETPGEDPVVASHYAITYVRGLQGHDEEQGNVYSERLLKSAELESSIGSGDLKVSACCKHFVAYDLEKWHNATRYTFNAQVSQQDLEDTYEPPFKSCIQDGQASCVMCSHNRVNGVPVCANGQLLTETVRNDWGLNGYITSDCDAVAVIYEYIHYAATPEDAAADVLLAGLDLDCGSYLSNHTIAAVQEGKLAVSSIDQALFNLFSVLMRLGMFDGDPKYLPYGELGANAICTPRHHQLALEAARQGIVLLKNDGKTLPLSKDNVNILAVVGPNANASHDSLLGDYAGIPCSYITPLQGLGKYANVSYQPGCKDVACKSDDFIDAAVDIVSRADAVILIVGLDQSQEREDHDRLDLVLPGQQQKLVCKVAASSRVPVVLVILSGGPVDVLFARDSSQIQSILWAGYPGQAGGQAIAEVIFGDYNPGGRLPVTWYPQSFVQVPMTDMNMRPDPSRGYPGRTYRFYTGKTVFQFGDGLSYTEFSHSFVSAPKRIILPDAPLYYANLQVHSTLNETLCESLTFDIMLRIRNLGSRGGSHVVLLFSSPPSTHSGIPHKNLLTFRRVHVDANAAADVPITIRPCNHMTTVKEDGKRVLGIGFHTLMVDGAQHSISSRHLIEVSSM
eukprot:c24568_g1_i1 orf=97-2478(+)